MTTPLPTSRAIVHAHAYLDSSPTDEIAERVVIDLLTALDMAQEQNLIPGLHALVQEMRAFSEKCYAVRMKNEYGVFADKLAALIADDEGKP